MPGPHNSVYSPSINLNEEGNTHQHQSSSDASCKRTGSYGYTNADGIFRLVEYEADENGFRAVVRPNEPGTATGGSVDANFDSKINDTKSRPPPVLTKVLQGILALRVVTPPPCRPSTFHTVPTQVPLKDSQSCRKPPYKFGYHVLDGHGHQHREEKSDGVGNVRGSYGYTDAYGHYRQVDYVADQYGFRAKVLTNEPGTASQNPANVKV
ncbi:unnamed protein product, partial [Ixodes hexagonus]